MKFLLLVCMAVSLMAQPASLKVEGVTATQVVVSYVAPSTSACTLELSESATYSPLVHDVNSSLFASSNSDTRAVTGSGVAGLRRVVLGTRSTQANGNTWYSRALAADTDHFLRVTCGSAASISFRTGMIRGIAPNQPEFNSAAWGNHPTPSFDWTNRNVQVVDSDSGAKVQRITEPGDLAGLVDTTSTVVLNGSGWTGLSDLVSGATSPLASTDNTNSAFVWVDTTASKSFANWNSTLWNGLGNLGVKVYGQGSDANPTNRVVNLCISNNGGQSCLTDVVPVTLPQTTSASVGTFPTDFALAFFRGWSKAPTKDLHTTSGTVTVSGTTVTRAGGDPDAGQSASWFRREWATGIKIYIAGSSPTCTNNLCTLVSVQSRNSLTISESLTIGSAATFKTANFGVMIAKSNTTGTASVSVSLRQLAYKPMHGEFTCSTQTVSTTVSESGSALGRTITGRTCLIQAFRSSTPSFYFIGESEPTVRLLSLLQIPAGMNGAGYKTSGVALSVTDPDVMVTNVVVGGKNEIFRMEYSGDYRQTANIQNTYNPTAGNVTGYTDPVTWTGVATGVNSVDDKIAAAYSWPVSQFGALSLSFQGVTGDYAIYYDLVASQNTNCGLFAINALTGNYANGLDTLSGSTGGLGWTGCHSFGLYGNRVWATTGNQPYEGGVADASIRYWGPFTVIPSHIYKSGAWSTDISLPWGPDSSYDSECSADVPQVWKDYGAVGTNCVKIRFPRQPCSATPATGEAAASPCPGDAAKSYIGRNVAVGDAFFDQDKGPQDDESFLVVKITYIGGTQYEVEALRDQANGYRCQKLPDPRGRRCVADPPQATHVTGWNARFTPRCYMTIWDPATGLRECRNEWLNRGHSDVTTLPGGQYSVVGSDGDTQTYSQSPVSNPAALTGATPLTESPKWPYSNAGFYGGIQSYAGAEGKDTTGENQKRMTNWRHWNGGVGIAPEVTDQTVGSVLTITLQEGTSGVYKVSPINNLTDIKTQPLHVWVGQYILADISSAATGNQITDATPWGHCYALAVNECRSGSSIGDFYISVPGGVDTDITTCNASQVSYRSICVFASTPISAQLVQLRTAAPDYVGNGQRTLGYAFSTPGEQYVYSHLTSLPNGLMLGSTAYNYQGNSVLATIIRPGAFDLSGKTGNGYVPVTVKAAGNVYVEFGYDSNFYCTSRLEACRVTASTIQSTPFKYAGETDSGTASSATVTIPALPGRVLYYRVVSSGVPGALQVVAP